MSSPECSQRSPQDLGLDDAVLVRDLAGVLRVTVGVVVEFDHVPPERSLKQLVETIEQSGRRVVFGIDGVKAIDGADLISPIRQLVVIGKDVVRIVISGQTVSYPVSLSGLDVHDQVTSRRRLAGAKLGVSRPVGEH